MTLRMTFNSGQHLLPHLEHSLMLTTVQRTSTVRLNLQPNSPNTQLLVNRLLLKKMIPAKKTREIIACHRRALEESDVHFPLLPRIRTGMNDVCHGQVNDEHGNRCLVARGENVDDGQQVEHDRAEKDDTIDGNEYPVDDCDLHGDCLDVRDVMTCRQLRRVLMARGCCSRNITV